jgi:hypothetical protein
LCLPVWRVLRCLLFPGALGWPVGHPHPRLTKTVSYLVRRRWSVYRAGYVELDCSGRAVGDREAVDPTVEGAASGRRNSGHA